MLKRYSSIILICLFALVVENGIVSAACRNCQMTAGYGFASYPKQLEETLRTATLLPEVKALIQRVNREGQIRLAIDTGTDFQAYWDSPTRTIAVNPSKNPTQGSWISSIVFELHNAASDKQLNYLTTLAIKGMISKEAYVEKVEGREHDNAIQACTILKKGIRTNQYPEDAEWNVFRSFDDHYALQQITGHSQDIASAYDRMHRGRWVPPYRGTTRNIQHFSKKEQERYIRYLSIKNDLESADRDEIARAAKYLQKEYEMLEQCYLGKSDSKDCADLTQNLRLMENVFKGNPIFETMIKKSPMFARTEVGSNEKERAKRA